MLLDSVKNYKYSNLSFLKAKVQKPSAVSFMARDVFTPSSRIEECEFAKDIPEATRAEIKEKVRDIANNGIDTYVGTGANGVVYKLHDTKTKKDYAVKMPHLEPVNLETGEKQRVNHDFKNEKDVLKLIDDLNSNFQKFVGYFKLNDGRNILVTTYINGMNPGIPSKQLNEKNLSSILEMLFELDCANILHRDLKKENIKINEGNQAGIFDFSEGIKFDITDTKTNVEENSFPIFEAPTNLRNFEDTLLTPYLYEFSKINPKKAEEFFKKYLKLKSEFHFKKAQYFNNQLQNSLLNSDEKENLERMIDYEETLSKVFKNPDDNIIETELHKNNITYNSELAYKNEILLLNPLANIALKANSLIEAKKLENCVDNQLKKPNSIEKRRYYEYKKEEAKFRQQKVASWTQGLTGWFLDCLTTDINEADENKKTLINQCIAKKDLTDFEIPNIDFEA